MINTKFDFVWNYNPYYRKINDRDVLCERWNMKNDHCMFLILQHTLDFKLYYIVFDSNLPDRNFTEEHYIFQSFIREYERYYNSPQIAQKDLNRIIRLYNLKAFT